MPNAVSLAPAVSAQAVAPTFHEPLHTAHDDDAWWRSSVIYQVYPRSFRDLNGDGQGDLAGITAELHQLADLSIDAIWMSPFYTSPQRDGGYDVADYCDVDPMFGTLDDFDRLTARASELGIKVIVDLVPNHCSSDHSLFKAALAAGPGSEERAMFIFRDGTGPDGSNPPNNWQSHFGGSAWTRTLNDDGTPGQWYLHLFDSSQPDFNWDNPAVHSEFERILRFWLDRNVSGFRVDVAHALVKAEGLPDWDGRPDGGSTDGYPGHAAPMFGQKAIHDIYRRWRSILGEYDGDRILCAEASIDPLSRLVNWVREDQMHQAFNFAYLHHPWDAAELRGIITSSLQAFDSVGAPTTWVLSNHDVPRHATRFGEEDPEVGLDRARAASLAMLALPGGVYLYQGEELGLPDHLEIPDELRQDPTFIRTGGERVGRDGCRVPLPWQADEPHYGFGSNGGGWLPQPEDWYTLARDVQQTDPASTLNLYRSSLALRKQLRLGAGSLSWAADYADTDTIAFSNNDVMVIMNMGESVAYVPSGTVIAASHADAGADGVLAPNRCVWVKLN
ncbi:glycoside hydrolase family 13 protein [Arthrobacter tumbae]|uniref:glycoside hydrolase family 13 protein n=1 Tax=Arthrobacter tumbae TaxID=163874 RepID=UPI00195A5100|nr:glycoside hydrolase family 13 protein [Arthrobacter tumbae]MBM7780795.1 alpha-glucosidase [Arthrobacter tumbae]